MKLNRAFDCYDEQVLLDYLVGELDSGAARDVEQHLKLCTDCALRADQLSEDFADVGRAIEIELPLPPLRLAAARARLQQRQEAYETNRTGTPVPVPLGGTYARIVLAAAIVTLLVGAAAMLLPPRGEPALTAGQVLARARESKPNYEMRPSMVRYQVEFAQIEPEPVVQSNQLLIWSDPSTGGYTSRLEDWDGSLRHAVWRSASGKPALSYDAGTGGALTRIDQVGGGRQPNLLASMGNGMDCDALARGFMRWLEGRSWQPVDLSADFGFLASDGTALQLERTGDVLLVVAHRQVGESRAEVTLALSAESYQPYFLQIHFMGPQGASTVKLVPNEVRFIAAAHLDASVFEARLPSDRPERARSVPPPRPQSVPASDSPDPRTMEARLRYALHEAAACLGEPVQVVLGSRDRFAVRGIVGTSETKARILAELARSDVPASVSVDILTRAEAIANVAESRSQSQSTSVQPGIRPPTEVRGAAGSVPIAADLITYFQRNGLSNSPSSIREQLGAFTRGAVDRADGLLQGAWALRRLAEQYGERTTADFSPEAVALVREMADDHISAFAADVHESADWMLPVFAAVAKSRGVEAGAFGPDWHPAAQARPSWPDSFLALFESASSIHEDTLALVTVRLDISNVPAGAISWDRSINVEQTLVRLLQAFRTLRSEIARTPDAFAAISEPASAMPLGRGLQR